mgnify:CR=1 FL=1
MLRILLSIMILSSCTYNPVVDHRGNNGQEVAYRYNDDLQTCRAIAKENTNELYESTKKVYNWYIRPQLLWFPDKLEYDYKPMVNKCLQERGHSILS